eukprot:jgi/Psemu1/21758/gm1.21758_g
MSMKGRSAQEERRAFVDVVDVAQAAVILFHVALWKLQSQTPMFRVAQLCGTYFKIQKEGENERERDEALQLDLFQSSPALSLGTNDNIVDMGESLVSFTIWRKRERKKKHAVQAMVKRSNTINKGHLCLSSILVAVVTILHPNMEVFSGSYVMRVPHGTTIPYIRFATSTITHHVPYVCDSLTKALAVKPFLPLGHEPQGGSYRMNLEGAGGSEVGEKHHR